MYQVPIPIMYQVPSRALVPSFYKSGVVFCVLCGCGVVGVFLL